jgi:hypothetical protein
MGLSPAGTRQSLADPRRHRVVAASPHDAQASPCEAQASRHDVQASPCDAQASPHDGRPSARHFQATPCEAQRLPREGRACVPPRRPSPGDAEAWPPGGRAGPKSIALLLWRHFVPQTLRVFASAGRPDIQGTRASKRVALRAAPRAAPPAPRPPDRRAKRVDGGLQEVGTSPQRPAIKKVATRDASPQRPRRWHLAIPASAAAPRGLAQ